VRNLKAYHVGDVSGSILYQDFVAFDETYNGRDKFVTVVRRYGHLVAYCYDVHAMRMVKWFDESIAK
jgi:hypothetical protein